MKLKPFILAFVLSFFFSLNTLQAQAFKEGDAVFSGGYGLGNITQTDYKTEVYREDLRYYSLGPVFFKAEYGLSNLISIGVNVAYLNITTTFTHTYDSMPNSKIFHDKLYYEGYSILPRLNFHFGDGEKFDPYLGLGVGYKNSRRVTESDDPYFTFRPLYIPWTLGAELTFGMRYYIIENFGLYTEIGFSKAFLQLGIVYKL